jgi:hypothetical protein
MTSGRPVSPGTVCACCVSPLGHSLTPVFLRVTGPGRFRFGASETSVIPA